MIAGVDIGDADGYYSGVSLESRLRFVVRSARALPCFLPYIGSYLVPWWARGLGGGSRRKA